jgi:hypothetical protein
MARSRHWSYKQIHVLNRPLAEVKFELTARQFNGVRVDLDQAVNAWQRTTKFGIQQLKGSIERSAVFDRRMARLELLDWFRLHAPHHTRWTHQQQQK